MKPVVIVVIVSGVCNLPWALDMDLVSTLGRGGGGGGVGVGVGFGAGML